MAGVLAFAHVCAVGERACVYMQDVAYIFDIISSVLYTLYVCVCMYVHGNTWLSHAWMVVVIFTVSKRV
jgi:hypothetical protein